MDITSWLQELGLGQYAAAFHDNAIAADVLPTLTSDDLRELGVGPLGDRKRILAAAAALGRASPLPAGERRQVTIVFCDIVGFTELNARLGAERTHALLNRFFATVDGLVQSYGGTVDKHMGDSVMAVFGAPQAHTDDPERAGQLAVALHGAMPPLAAATGCPIRVHIGIASGQVVASRTGSATHGEYTVTGPAVNLAARLLELAGPGETLIADAVHAALSPRLVREAVGEIAIRGLPAAERVWRITGLVGRDAACPATDFVGRQSELAQFAGIAGACRDTAAGRVVYLRGEAGVGKTRLLSRFLDIAADLGFACHHALVLDFGEAKGEDVLRTLVRSLLAIADDDSATRRRAAAAQAVAAGLIDPDDHMFLVGLVDAPMPPDLRGLYEAMDNDARTAGRRRVLAHLAARLTATAPLVIAVEDVHWAGAPELQSLTVLAAELAAKPAVLLLTSRPDGDPLSRGWRDVLPTGAASIALITMDLTPLGQPESRALARQLVGDDDAPFARRCIDRAEGNPLFLEQLLRGGATIGDDDMPGSLRSVVLARVDGLPPADKHALQAAAVLGQKFPLPAVRHMAEQPDYDPTLLLDQGLVRHHGDELLFGHALIRDGVYTSLLKARLRQLHLRAAAWFEGRDAVLHAEHLDRAGDPAAPGAYLSAARAHAAEYRFGRALELIDRALPLAYEPEQVAVISCFRGDLLREVGDLEASIATFRAAAADAPDDACRCYAWIGLAEGLRVVDAHDEAVDVLARAQPIAEREGRSDLLARIHTLRGNLCFPLGDLDGCRTEQEKALHYARAIGSREAEARALGGLGDAAYFRAHIVTAERHYGDCVSLANSHGLVRIEVANVAMLAFTEFFQNKPEAAIAHATRAAESAARIGDLRAGCLACNVLCAIYTELDRFDEAAESCRRSVQLADTIGSPRFRSDNLGHLATIHYCRGDVAAAHQISRDAMAAGQAFGVSYAMPWILANAALHHDDTAEKYRLLAEAHQHLGPNSPSHTHLYFHKHAIDVYLGLGDWDRVRDHAEALRDFVAAEPFPWAELHICRGLALAEHGAGGRTPALHAELERLRAIARHAGLARPAATLQAALDAVPGSAAET